MAKESQQVGQEGENFQLWHLAFDTSIGTLRYEIRLAPSELAFHKTLNKPKALSNRKEPVVLAMWLIGWIIPSLYVFYFYFFIFLFILL